MSPVPKKQKLSEDGKYMTTFPLSNRKIQPINAASQEENEHPCTLFVRALAPNTTTEKLAKYFSQVAVLKHAVAVLEKETGRCRGYGFVTFADSEDAAAARNTLNGTLFEGRTIQIFIAEPRHRRMLGQSIENEEGVRQIFSNREAGQGLIVDKHKGPLHEKVPRIIVRNLPWTVNEPEQLASIFMSYGKIKDVKLPKDQKGRLRGFGFVLLRGYKNAEKAVAGLNGKVLDGRTLAVDWAAPKDIWAKNQRDEDRTSFKPEYQDILSGLNHSDTFSYSSAPSEISDAHDLSSPEQDVQGDISIDESRCHSGQGSDSEGDLNNEDKNSSVFVRNLPFNVNDTDLYEHFSRFGAVRYAKVVLDFNFGTEGRSKGTGFVGFYRIEDAQKCLRDAPRVRNEPGKVGNGNEPHRSVLEDTSIDNKGLYTIEGRVLQISQCVEKCQARKLEAEGRAIRAKEDTRHIFLLREGAITRESPLFDIITLSEAKMREDSARQRQDLIRRNPSLHISLTRLAIRNIPRFLSAKELKALARKAVVGFATDVKEGHRQPLSSEERNRSDGASRDAERRRKAKGKGIVKQAKIVFENREGQKVSEKGGAGRSRGYGFVEYTSHRCALMGLRWLNGHLVTKSKDDFDSPGSNQVEAPKRLIVEFAIENAQVVQRRKDCEIKSRQRYESNKTPTGIQPDQKGYSKEEGETYMSEASLSPPQENRKDIIDLGDKEALRQKIVGRKRAKRKTRESRK